MLFVMTTLRAAVTACVNDGARSSPGRPYSVDMVCDAFEQETGDELIIEDEARDLLIIEDATLLGVAAELDAKYGDFGFAVFHRMGRQKRALLNCDPRIRWEYHPPE